MGYGKTEVMNRTSPRFLFFSLHPTVLPFVISECVTGDVLLSVNVQPVMIRPLGCGCQVSGGRDILHLLHARPCEKCRVEFELVRSATPGWKHEVLSDYAQSGDEGLVKRLLEHVTPENFREFKFQGISVGQIAVHDVVLDYKRDTLEFDLSSDIWRKCFSLIYFGVLSTIWMGRAIKKINPIGLSVYNSNYSINRMICRLMETEGIPHYSMHGGASLRHTWDTLMLVRGDISTYRLACCENWENSFSKRILGAADIRLVGEHFEELFAGRNAHAYSPPVGASSCSELLSKVNPLNSRKVVLLALSSTDERVALEQSGIQLSTHHGKDLFSTQRDWIEFFIEKARERNDLAFIIRVHPREFPNKREGKTSENATRLVEFLVNLPENVVVDWPDRKVSYYELLQRTDLVLSMWSSVVLEASLFGCPFVLPQSSVANYLYRGVADGFCSDLDEYWSVILESLGKGWSIDRAVRTFRWYWLIQHGGTVDITSREKRVPGFCEELDQLFFSWKSRVRDWMKRLKLNVFSNLDLRSVAFDGNARALANRPNNVIGSKAISSILLGRCDPMNDFEELRRLQGKVDACLDVDDERHAVALEIESLLRYFPKVTEGAASNITGMLDAGKKG